MPVYPYAPRLSPAAGNGLGGLPRKKEGSGGSLPVTIYIDSGSGDYKIPAGFSQARVIAVGPGGTSGTRGGGGGGGLAGTVVVKVNEGEVINYVVGSANNGSVGIDTTVKFKGYTLVGGAGGYGGATSGGVGGVGSGGDFNFSGGTGGTGNSGSGSGGGGGSAGINGNGGAGGNANGGKGQSPAVTSGEGAGGSGGGASTATNTTGGGGGGPGQQGGFGAGRGGFVQPSRASWGLPGYLDADNYEMPGSPGGGAGGYGRSGFTIGANGGVRIDLYP